MELLSPTLLIENRKQPTIVVKKYYGCETVLASLDPVCELQILIIVGTLRQSR